MSQDLCVRKSKEAVEHGVMQSGLCAVQPPPIFVKACTHARHSLSHVQLFATP